MNGTLPPGDRGHRSRAAGGNPDVEGLVLALAAWRAELSILWRRVLNDYQESR